MSLIIVVIGIIVVCNWKLVKKIFKIIKEEIGGNRNE